MHALLVGMALAAEISCEEVAKMVEVGVPHETIVQNLADYTRPASSGSACLRSLPDVVFDAYLARSISPVVSPPRVAPGTLAALDAKTGFRDVLWGSAPTADMTLVETGKDGTTYYRRPSDSMTVGAAQLEAIAYFYWRDQFLGVMLMSEGYANARALLATLQEAYGEGHQGNQFMERYHWFGKTVTLSFDQKSSDDAVVVFRYEPLQEKQKAAEKDAAKSGAQDL